MSVAMDCNIRVWCKFLLILFLCTKASSYEKTLRKIVRNQYKMIQRPFSETSGPSVWQNSSMSTKNYPSGTQKTLNHKLAKFKISTILSSVDAVKSIAARSKTKYLKKTEMLDKQVTNSLQEQDFAPLANTLMTASTQANKMVVTKEYNQSNDANSSDNLTIKNFYKIPEASKFFPLIFDRDTSLEQKGNTMANTIIIPTIPDTSKDNETGTIQIKGILIPKSQIKSQGFVDFEDISPNETLKIIKIDGQEKKIDYVIEGLPTDKTKFINNITVDPFSCLILRETFADIDAQEKFAQFNIEPLWMVKKQYWNKLFESRYESLMRNPRWPSLQVFLIPRVHVDTIWKKTFEQYNRETVSAILSNMIKKLQFYQGLTFSWNEVSHLSLWWKKTTTKNRVAFRKLLKDGRLEITTGGWVETDEATTDLFGLVHQLIEGHQWLKQYLNHSPKVAWLTNSVSHSPTMIYLLSTLNIHHVVFTNVHYSWERFLAEYQYSDFVWIQNWDNDKLFASKLNEDLGKMGEDRYPQHAALTHYMQFNSAGFQACGPNGDVCASNFNFASPNKNFDLNPYNIKDRAEQLLEQYSKAGSISLHNTIIAPIGGPYHYDIQTEFDFQYNNYFKILDFVNANVNIYKATIEFGTTQDYFDAIMSKHKRYPTLKGDFMNFADISSKVPAYWTGYYTSRPFTKILLRRLQSTLRTTEILLSFALNLNVFRQYNLTDIFKLLLNARQNVARLLDRNVVSGTVTAKTLKYVHNLILSTVKDCWFIQELTVSFLILKSGQTSTRLQKYVYKDGEFMSVFRSISPGDQICIFNSLSHERTEIVEIVTRNPNIRILDRNKKDVKIQVNPIWKYNSNNVVTLSRRFFKVCFPVVVPPMTLVLYKIKETYDAALDAASIYCLSCVMEKTKNSASQFPFSIQPIQAGDIQLESFKHRLMFDEYTGFLKTVVEKETNVEKTVYIDYGAFKAASFNSGMFLFNTNTSKPLHDILMDYKSGRKSIIIIIISGQVTTELVAIYGNLLQHTTKIFNLVSSPLSNAIYVESKVDYELSPNNRELELFLSIGTDILNGNPPQIYTDNNSFQYTSRFINLSRRVESNVYPITSMVFIQDKWSRLTYVTDHAQGVTALQEGQIIVMLDRRILYNDDRGTNEGLADSSATCHRHYLLLENLGKPSTDTFSHFTTQGELQLPSLNALHLANTLSYLSDMFVIEKNFTDLCYYTSFPLVKTGFPCDVAVLNYRVNLNRKYVQQDSPNSALLILHRQSFSCKVLRSPNHHCHGVNNFSIDKIMRNIKTVFQTNLAGTNLGKSIVNVNFANFPPMELMTLRINF